MKLIYEIGDMFESPSVMIAHGCNSHGVMGSGVAKTMVVRHYSAFVTYKNAHDLSGLHLGEVVFAYSKDQFNRKPKIIANCITQKDFGRDPNVVYVSYDGIRDAVRQINDYMRSTGVLSVDSTPHTQNGKVTVTFPLIGAGLANGDWGVIAKIIEDESTEFQPLIYVQNQATLDKALEAVASLQLTELIEQNHHHGKIIATCINNDTCPVSLTVGKNYEVDNLLDTPEGWYRICDDTDEFYLFPSEYFNIIKCPEISEECR
jgi:O-acetyl-ADP-ribose deacetylase (regulator of RNase III)